MKNKSKNLQESHNQQLNIFAGTCRLCWWREGDGCYLEPCERETDGRSKKIVEMTNTCDSFLDKRNYFINKLNGN